MRLHVVGPVEFAGLGVQAVDKAGEITHEQQAAARIDGDRRDAPVNALEIPEETALGDVARFGGVQTDQAADAFAVFGVLASGHIDAVLVKDRRGVDFAGTFGGGIFDRLALLGLVFGGIDISPPDLC